MSGFSTALGVTALVQAFVWESGVEREHTQVILWAQHELSAQRYARLVCLLYGSDPGRFGWVAEATDMGEIRAEGCVDEWRVAESAVLWVRGTYGIDPADRTVRQAADIGVKYGPPLDASEGKLMDLLKRHELLERTAESAENRFAFPEALVLKLSHCRVPNAYWDPVYREVVLCYELLTQFAELASRPEVSRVVARFYAGQQQTGYTNHTSTAVQLLSHQGEES